MALRRTLMVRWQPYMEESLEILRTSPGAVPSDQLLIYWAKLSHIAEDVAFQFSMDDPGINISLSEPKVQYALKGFEKQLEQWRSEVAPEYYSRTPSYPSSPFPRFQPRLTDHSHPATCGEYCQYLHA
jgi:hypothetical protein